MTCANQIGLKNLSLTLTDCDTGNVYAQRIHNLGDTELPSMFLPDHENQMLPTGKVLRQRAAGQFDMTVERDDSIPLRVYQSGSVELIAEYHSGIVISISGVATGRNMSNGHQVQMSIGITEVTELLPA